jgi:hypothetical protein
MVFFSMRFGCSGFVLVLGLALVLLPPASPASASTVFWTGASGLDGNWGTDNGGLTNWSGNTVPNFFGDDLVFNQPPASAFFTNNNDMSLAFLNSLSLSSTTANWSINGNLIELQGGASAITNNGGTNAIGNIKLNNALNTALGSTITSSSGALTLDGVLNANSQPLTLTGAGTLNIAANLTGAGTVASSAGTTNFNSGFLGTVPALDVTAGTTRVNSGAAGLITTLNSSGGATWIDTNTVGTVNAQAGGSVHLTGNVGTLNATGGTVNATAGTIGNLSLPSGTPDVTIGPAATVTNASVVAGTATFNSTAPVGALSTGGGTTNLNAAVGALSTGGGQVNIGPGVTAANAALGAASAVKADTSGNPLRVSSQLATGAGSFAWTPAPGGGAAFTVTGTNIANDGNPRIMTLTGGTLKAGGNPNSIAVHWSNYDNYNVNNVPVNYKTPQGVSNITGIDGVVPQSSWTNIGTKWYGVDDPNTNLVDNKGVPTTAAVGVVATGGGTHWWVTGPTAGLSNLLVGPWGGDGSGTGAGSAIPNVITGIPSSYSTYKIIAYANPPYPGQHDVWLDSNPASSNSANPPVAGSLYWFSQTPAPSAFVQMTNNTDNTLSPAGNYVVYSGLTGPAQTLWIDGLGGATNQAFTGFQIVDTSTIPNLDVPQTTIAVTVSSTLEVTQGVGTFGDMQVSGGQTLSLGGKVAAKTVSGAGSTSVLANSSLTADSIVQNTLSIGAGATVTIRETAGGSVSAVPEPGTWALLIAGAACCLPLLRRLRCAK